MAKLKIPTLQHLARQWMPTPEGVKNQLVKLALNPPTFNYNPLLSAVRDHLVFNKSFSEIAFGLRMGIRRENICNNYLEVLPLMEAHFKGVNPDYVISVERKMYAAGRGLLIPFEPPILYGQGGETFLPWFSFWKSNPLNARALSLFVSIINEIFLNDPDLENCHFEILDFSAPKNSPRILRTINSKDIPLLTSQELKDMLDIFVEGFYLAQTYLDTQAEPKEGSTPTPDPKQTDLFR